MRFAIAAALAVLLSCSGPQSAPPPPPPAADAAVRPTGDRGAPPDAAPAPPPDAAPQSPPDAAAALPPDAAPSPAPLADIRAARNWRKGQAPDFARCLRAEQCKSGICEGEGCDDQHPGTCRPLMEGCGQMAVQYCGCDGKSFSSSPCPRRRYRSRGAWCPEDPNPYKRPAGR